MEKKTTLKLMSDDGDIDGFVNLEGIVYLLMGHEVIIDNIQNGRYNKWGAYKVISSSDKITLADCAGSVFERTYTLAHVDEKNR